MDNPETLETLGRQHTGRRQTKHTKRYRTLKIWAIRTSPKTRSEPRCSQMTSAMLLI